MTTRLHIVQIDRKRKILTLSRSLPKVVGDFRLAAQEWAKWYIQVKP